MSGYAGLIQSVISALGVVGGVGSSLWSTSQAAGASNRARDWQKMMADSAYQRTVNDMRIAGLNPMMAFGMNMSTAPPAQAAQVFQPDIEGAVSSARQAMTAVEELKLLRATREKAEADSATAKEFSKRAPRMAESAMVEAAESADLRGRQAALTSAQQSLTDTQAEVQKVMKILEGTKVPGARAQMELDQSQFGEVLRKWNRIVRSTMGEDATSAR